MSVATSAIERLQDVAERAGAVTRADERATAAELHVPLAAVHGAATFYDDLAKTRRGSRHVRVCEGTACFAADGGQHVAEVERALGVSAGCLSRGRVGIAAGGALHWLLLCGTRAVGRDGAARRPELADEAGPRETGCASDPCCSDHRAGGARWHCRRRRPLAALARGSRVVASAETYRRAGGLRIAGPGRCRVSGRGEVVGRSGGPGAAICGGNGDEGDPGSFCDRVLMEQDPHRVLAGLAYAGHAVGAERGYVYVRSEYPAALESLNAAVAEATSAGHLGRNLHGTTSCFEVMVVEGAGSYVAGEETALLHALEGRRGAVRPDRPIPTSSGYSGHRRRSTMSKLLLPCPGSSTVAVRPSQLSAELLKPARSWSVLTRRSLLPASTRSSWACPSGQIIDELGGGLRDDRRLRSVQVGGPLGGFLAPDELDVPLLESALAAYGVALGHASLIAIDDRVPAAELLRHVWRFAAIESCGTCAPCRIGSGRGAALAERLVAGDTSALAEQQPLLATLETASMCAFGRGVPASVRSLLRVYADELPT